MTVVVRERGAGQTGNRGVLLASQCVIPWNVHPEHHMADFQSPDPWGMFSFHPIERLRRSTAKDSTPAGFFLPGR